MKFNVIISRSILYIGIASFQFVSFQEGLAQIDKQPGNPDEPVLSVERLSFRTGPYRTEPTRQTDRYAGGDLSNPGDSSLSTVYYIDEVMIK